MIIQEILTYKDVFCKSGSLRLNRVNHHLKLGIELPFKLLTQVKSEKSSIYLENQVNQNLNY